MRKVFALLIALSLFFVTGAMAHEAVYDPQTGLSYISVPVYNNAGATLTAGDVVVWDIDASTGDNDAYVTTTTTADTSVVAGIIWPSNISSGGTGSLAIWGLVQCDIAGSAGAPAPLCTSTTAGEAQSCGDEDASFGISVAAGTNTLVNCFVGN